VWPHPSAGSGGYKKEGGSGGGKGKKKKRCGIGKGIKKKRKGPITTKDMKGREGGSGQDLRPE